MAESSMYRNINPTNSDALLTTLSNAIQAVGRGFDVTSDIRLLYCKGAPGSRLIHLDEVHTRDVVISDDVSLPNVSVDIEYSLGNKAWEATPVCNFHEVTFSTIITILFIVLLTDAL